MENITEKYRISIYEEIVELSSNKIYIVRSSLDDKIYVKKVLPIENHEIYRQIKKMNIANIPKIYEIINMDDKVIIIEEYINGYSLKELLDEVEMLSEKIVIEYMLDLINILEELYSGSSHIIHRDIKPSNIMINNDGILKLIDFDISRIYKTDKSTDTMILGTYGYAAPEQFGFNQSDIRTDIYSIGATMNILLTGKLPVEEAYKGNIQKIISKCTEMDPNKRYQNISELKSELLKRYGKHSIEDKIIENKYYVNSRLPGFKSNRLVFKIVGSLWYVFLLMASLGVFDEEPLSEEQTLSIALALFLFSLTLLYGNYKDIKSKLPLIKSKNLLVQLLGYVLYTIGLLMVYGAIIPE